MQCGNAEVMQTGERQGMRLICCEKSEEEMIRTHTHKSLRERIEVEEI